MASELQITFLGALLAFFFAASMGILLWWMFHVPEAIPLAAAKARRAVGAIKKILVPTSGTFYSPFPPQKEGLNWHVVWERNRRQRFI